jgi:hypothetical protein
MSRQRRVCTIVAYSTGFHLEPFIKKFVISAALHGSRHGLHTTAKNHVHFRATHNNRRKTSYSAHSEYTIYVTCAEIAFK